jgi:eukaryotic-like serine/threonine-protein kinase
MRSRVEITADETLDMNALHQPDDLVANRYRIVAPLGRGTMATTYEAEDLTDCQRVAIKVVSFRGTTEWKILELFDREIKTLQNIKFPGIPKYLDSFQEETPDDRRFYLVQELVLGQSLAEQVEKGWHPQEEQVKHLARQLLKILDYLHSFTPPIIHRDIKPENIICCPDDSVYLVDFGAVQDVYRNTLTRGGTFVGTLGYMPHEQFRGQAIAASDLYALGATLLFLLAGKSPTELPQKRLRINFRSRVSVSPEFANWLEKILEPSVEDRFQSAREAAAELVSSKSEPIENSLYPNPQFYRAIVSRSDRHFLCKVPPNWGCIVCLLITVGAFFFVIFMGAGGSFLQILPVVSIFAIISSPFLITVSSWERLEIDRQIFTITSSFLGITYRHIQGKTSDIELVEAKVSIHRNKEGRTYRSVKLVLWEGIHKRYFGQMLSEFEKRRLANEISNFLDLEQLLPPEK